MLVKLIPAPGETAAHYLSVDTITEVKVYNDTNTISYTTTACDTYSEHFSSRDALDARFEEVQSWFALTSMSATIEETTVDSPTPSAAANNSMRNCNGYNTKACEHNGKAHDCSGCPFESTTKHLVDTFMQLPDTLKAQFIDEALSHQCITEDEFSMLMSTIPEEDPTPTPTPVDSTQDVAFLVDAMPDADAFFKTVATLQTSILQSTILPNAWKITAEVRVAGNREGSEHRLLIYNKKDTDFMKSIINDELNQFTSSATEAIDSIVDKELNIH